MSQGALISWKEESGTIHREMDRLLTAGWVETAEECRVRKIQFMTLIERRNVAAYNYLKSDGDTARVSINPQNPSDAPRRLPNLDPMFEVETQEPSEVALAIDLSPQAPLPDPVFEAEVMDGKVSQEPSKAAIAIDRGSQMPPANPMFEVKNFLKFLGLK